MSNGSMASYFGLEKVVAAVSWPAEKCRGCEDGEDYPSDCTCDGSVIAHRIAFTVNPKKSWKEAVSIPCSLDMFMELDDDFSWDLAEVEPGRAVKWWDDGVHRATTDHADFDCAVVSRDSELTIFEPHIDILKAIFVQYEELKKFRLPCLPRQRWAATNR